MNAKPPQANEQKLITIYMETTGASEASARSVLMLLDLADGPAPRAFMRSDKPETASIEEAQVPRP